jgi:hypothetical protein
MTEIIFWGILMVWTIVFLCLAVKIADDDPEDL